MSLAADTRSHTRVVKTQEEKGLLTLSDNLIKQVHYMHTVVDRNIEWSGILIYEVKEGDVNNPKGLSLFVHEFIPMDVGTSGYTEYEYSSEDDYSFERIADALEKGYKLGQIHTHHSMGTFFSGVDMSELHDNVSKHNFYLSLIVDYKNHEDWVAKVAIDGKEVTSGTVNTSGFTKKTGVVTKTISWNGRTGSPADVSDVDHEEYKDHVLTEVIDEVTPILFVIDMDITLEPAASEWETRVETLNNKRSKGHQFTHSLVGNSNWGNWNRNQHPSNKVPAIGAPRDSGSVPDYSYEPGIGYVRENPITDARGNPFKDDDYDEEKDEYEFGQQNVLDFDTDDKPYRKNLVFDPDTSLPLLIMLINLNPAVDKTPLLTVLAGLERNEELPKWSREVDYLIESWAESYFNVGELDDEDMNCIALSMLHLINSIDATGVEIAVTIIESVLEPYLLPDSWINYEEIMRLTGVDPTKY
jgi:hypothetical protein